MPVQEHKSGVGVSYISVSSLSAHSLARWAMGVLQQHMACEHTGKHRVTACSEYELALAIHLYEKLRLIFTLMRTLRWVCWEVKDKKRKQERERERENIYHHSASPPFHKFRTMQEGHSLFTSLVKSCGGPRGARGTEREKACGFYKESICIAQRKHWLEKKKKKVLLMKTTAEYERSRFKQAKNNTLVSGTLKITIRIIYISD